MTNENAKRNAQSTTCFTAALACGGLSVAAMLFAIVFPTFSDCSVKVTCWISMGTELISILLAYIALWIKRNAL